jgi:hypothetical protein
MTIMSSLQRFSDGIATKLGYRNMTAEATEYKVGLRLRLSKAFLLAPDLNPIAERQGFTRF